MAVYTDLSDEDVETLLANYDLGRPLALKGIAEGVENSNFLLETEAGRFILTIFEKRVQESDLPFFMAVMEGVARAGVPAPRPRALRSGERIGRVRNKPCAIITFLNGMSPKRPNVAQCRAIGESLARMHLGLADFDMLRPNSLSPSAWESLVSPRLNLADSLSAGLSDDITADLSAIQQTWPTNLPMGVIHADLFPDNALFVGDRLCGVIDFYFACTDALAYDLAICLNAWCFEGDRSYNLTKGMAMVAGYQSVRTLTQAERDALPILARGAAMRFFATRLADWATTPQGALVRPKDPLEYAAKLAFHRRTTSAQDYGA